MVLFRQMNMKIIYKKDSNYKYFSVYLNLLFILFAAAMLFTQNIENLLNAVPDDAFYYFKIADNIIQTGKLTFDGFSNTNGFHPLWLLFILPVKFFVNINPESNVKVILLIQLTLCCISVNLLIKSLKNFYKSTTLILVFSYFCFKFIGNYVNGLESSLLFLLYTVLFCYSVDKRFGLSDSNTNYFVLGVISGFIVLARLDQIFLISSFVLYALVSNTKPFSKRIKDIITFLAGFIIIFAPYLICNSLYFESLMPISGKLKSTFPHISFGLKLLYDCLNKVTILALLSVLWVLIAKFKNIKFVNEYFEGIFIVFGLTVLSHFLHTVMFMNWAAFSWHYSFYLLFILLVLLEPVEKLLSFISYKKRIILVVILFLLINIFSIRDAYMKVQVDESNSWKIQVYRSAILAKYNSDYQTVFAMSDAGIFSYFSERRVVNLDGLVNNLDYQDVLKNGKLNSYLKDRNVKYLVHHSVWNQSDVISGEYQQYAKSYESRLYEGKFDYIVLEKKDEVYRSNIFFDGPYNSVLIIWKINQ